MNEQNIALWERRLGDGLNALADEEAPAPTVTVADVIASGREVRRSRRNRATWTLSAVLVVVIALTAGALAAFSRGSSAAPPAVDGGVTVAPSASMGITFGWLPSPSVGAYVISQQVSGPDLGQPVVMGSSVNGGGALSTALVWSRTMTMSATAFKPGVQLAPGTTWYSAGTVRGRQARWAVFSSKMAVGEGGFLDLVWQYEPNAWASVSYNGETSMATRTMLLKVADNLVIGQGTYVMPFHMAKLPAGMHTDAALLNFPQAQNPHTGFAQLRLCVASPCTSVSLHGGLLLSQQPVHWRSFSQILDNGDFPYIDPETGRVDALDQNLVTGSEPATVDGQSAKLWYGATGATVAFAYDGTFVQISAADAEYQAIGGKAGLLAFTRSLTFYGADPAQWTTKVAG